jgi:TonB family protein
VKALVIYIALLPAMILPTIAGTRKPYSIPMPYAPLPEYPTEAQAKHWTGSALFMVSVDSDNGQVNGVNILHSTGHSILDKAAEKALYTWKFSHGVRSMQVPVTFATNGVHIGWPKRKK